MHHSIWELQKDWSKMTIEKGKDWGRRGEVGVNTPVARSDAELSEFFQVDESSGTPCPKGPELVALVPNGDETVPKDPRLASNGLALTLGARGTVETVLGHERTIVPIDLGVVVIHNGSTPLTMVMSSSLVIASKFWSGPIEGAMNSSFLGEWNVTPSGHPNDGRFDVISAELPMSDRMKARKRLPSGSHVPHPAISIRRLRSATFTPPPSARVWVDGRALGSAARVEVSVFPDAVELAI